MRGIERFFWVSGLALASLYLLARGLPTRYRLRGGSAIVVALTIGATAGFAVYSALVGLR